MLTYIYYQVCEYVSTWKNIIKRDDLELLTG